MLFIAFSHPLILVIVLIAQTLPVVIIVNYSQDTNWLSYMLFLIFLGGLLVIFTYLSALIPNEVFSVFTPTIILLILVIATRQSNLIDIKQERIINLSMFSLTNTSTTIPIIILYLLSALCVTIFICNKIKSPLKQNNN